MKRLLWSFLLLTFTAMPLMAQDDDDEEYTKEIGVGLGGNFMLSDYNSTWYGQMGFTGNALFRFVISPRMAVKIMAGYNMTHGSTTKVNDFYPATLTEGSTTERLVKEMKGGYVDLSGLYELHFLPYGWFRTYLGHYRITPYIQLGLGLTYSTVGKAFTLNIPIGLGLKWKIARRLNLGLDWTFHFTPCDKLDGLEAPQGIKSTLFRNKDHYQQTLITLTYDISPKCPTCNRN